MGCCKIAQEEEKKNEPIVCDWPHVFWIASIAIVLYCGDVIIIVRFDVDIEWSELLPMRHDQ